MMEYTERLKELLKKAVEKRCDTKTGIIFSGGIDSTIIAMLASEFSDVTAYSCGIKGSPDLEHAKKCRNLGFKIKILEIDEMDVEGSLSRIINSIDDRNPVKVSVEVPFYFASKTASGDGLSTVLCGQGADELFGGYNRYLDALPDYEKAGEMIERDVDNIYRDQLDKDIAVCKSNGVELRAPYVDDEFKDFAMKIPVDLKVHEVGDLEEFSCFDVIDDRRFIRKYILRKLGTELGVPDFIINRKKKAAQYGSGTAKIVEKIARKKGFKRKASDAGRNDYVRFFLENYAVL